MQENFKYNDKYVSILGDSVSSLEGFNPEGYAVFFAGENRDKWNIHSAADTWWGEVIEDIGAKLLKNDSWSGSLVSAEITQKNIFPSASSDERTSHLHTKDAKPDLIFVYIGINDYATGAPLIGVQREVERYNYRYFNFAYNKMLEKLKQNYPQSQIFCISLTPTKLKGDESFSFPLEYMNNRLDTFNNSIKLAAKNSGCNFIDTFKYNEPLETLDTAHPTKEGMHTFAKLIMKELDALD